MMGLKTLKDYQGKLKGKKVIMRVDYNVPVDKATGAITNDRRIQASLPTIKLLLDEGAKLILMTHLGRPDGQVVEKLRLDNVAARLAELMPALTVHKLDTCVGEDVTKKVEKLAKDELGRGCCRGGKKFGSGAHHIILLENIRFEPGEEKNDEALSKQLAALADFYVNDAFGTAHRAHASTEGVAHFLNGAAGLIIEREVKALSRALQNPPHPYLVILGGAKVSDKIGVIENLSKHADKLVVGGAMAYTFMKAKGEAVGKSKVEDGKIDKAKELLDLCGDKLVLPTDHVCAPSPDEGDKAQVVVGRVPDGQMGLDIGPATRVAYIEEIKRAKMIVWNGPMGFFEKKAFAEGTKALASAVAASDAESIVGGGETAEAVDQLGLEDKITHVSTGGGASLEFLENTKLPGIAILEK